MKKFFIAITALMAFVACQSNFEDIGFDAPQGGVGTNDDLITIYAEVSVGEETKATYDNNLSAMWEANDQIALLQESANYGSAFTTVNKLGINTGANSNSATFKGDVTVQTSAPRIYHIAYPTSAVSFSTSSSLTAVNVSYEDSYTLAGYDNVTATGEGQYTYNSTLNITLPTSQSGKWEPYMYASTSEAVAADAIGANTLTTLTGAIAIRAFKNDGTTPLQLRTITVTASKPIAGLFEGTATSVGTTTSVSGDETGNKSTVSNTAEEIQAMALNNLLEKLQDMQPATTSVTKAMSFSFAGSENTITADVSAVGADSDGNYTYHLNVAPFENADLTITATATDGSSLVRTVTAQSIAASHRKGYIFTWEAASITDGSIDTWYDSYSNNHSTTLEGGKVYVNNITVTGIDASAVQSIGAVVYDSNNNIIAQNLTNNTLSLSQVVIDVAAGTYKVGTYAEVVVNGESLTLKGVEKQVNVTPIPTDNSLIQTSYSKNGVTTLTNSIGGTTLEYTPALNVTIPSGFIKGCQVTYGSTTDNATLGSKVTKILALGAYNCSVKTTLGNGYVCQSATYATHITGIPYTMNTSSNDGWSRSNDTYTKWGTDGGVRLGKNAGDSDIYIQRSFHIPANVTVKVTANGVVNGTWAFGDRANTATIQCGTTTVINTTSENSSEVSFSCNSLSAPMTPSSNIVKCNSSYNISSSKVVIKALKIEF